MALDETMAPFAVGLFEVEATGLASQPSMLQHRLPLALFDQLSASLSPAMKARQDTPLLCLNDVVFIALTPSDRRHILSGDRFLDRFGGGS